MSLSPSFQGAWEAYQSAVSSLYTEQTGAQARRGAGVVSEDAQEKAGTLLVNAQKVRSALVAGLQAEDPSQRELAGLKLLAAAASDLTVADDLLQRDAAGSSGRVTRSTNGMLLMLPLLQQVLDAPLQEGMHSLQRVRRVSMPADVQGARTQLGSVIETFLQNIPQTAAALSQTAVNNALSLAILQTQLPNIQEILRVVPSSLSPLASSAVNLVMEAVHKLWAAIGKDEQKNAMAQAVEWLQAIEGHVALTLLNLLYETERIGQETKGLVIAAPANTEASRYNEATQNLQKLLSGYNTTKGVLTQMMQVLGWAKGPLLLIPMWGPVALYMAYLGILGYAVYSGGDYLDWYRTGDIAWLDRVYGLRKTVQLALCSKDLTNPPQTP